MPGCHKNKIALDEGNVTCSLRGILNESWLIAL